MKTASYLTGNILFDGDLKVSDKTTITLAIEDVTTSNKKGKVLEKKLDFDSKTLPIFRYIPFELKEFELEPDRRYSLSAFVDVASNGSVESGDYLTKRSYPVVTGFEEIDLQMERVR
jgi:hypothetical protein